MIRLIGIALILASVHHLPGEQPVRRQHAQQRAARHPRRGPADPRRTRSSSVASPMAASTRFDLRPREHLMPSTSRRRTAAVRGRDEQFCIPTESGDRRVIVFTVIDEKRCDDREEAFCEGRLSRDVLYP